jgi:protein SMG5
VTTSEDSPSKSDPAIDQERKSRLMRDMAALRLQAEISQLENSLKNEEFSLPPILVIDSSVLCTNLNLIQKFVQSQRFIIVIPLVGELQRENFTVEFLFILVIDILDELKKEQREARDAIRWLENQFRAGNR